MKTIEERAKEYSDRHKSIENSYFKGYNYNIAEKYDAEKFAYEAGAYDQKAIDEAEWLKDDEINYQQGYHDAIEKAKNAFGKACGRLSTYPWYNAMVEEFMKNMEE